MSSAAVQNPPQSRFSVPPDSVPPTLPSQFTVEEDVVDRLEEKRKIKAQAYFERKVSQGF